MSFTKKCTGVYCYDSEVVRIGEKGIRFLKENLDETLLRRVRICVHQGGDDPLHEMIILIAGGSYIRPHKHLHKSESFHIIEGIVDVVLFDEDGHVSEVVKMGPYGSGRCFFYRLNTACYHTLIIYGENVVVHETTNGPFTPCDTVFASWAPDGSDPDEITRYLIKLEGEVFSFC